MTMRRREFLLAAGGAALALAWKRKDLEENSKTALATVGVVTSDFAGSRARDGSRIAGLAEPRPVNADLTSAQVDAMVRKALEIGDTSASGLTNHIQPTDWVVIKPNIVFCPGLSEVMHVDFVPGMVADLRVVRGLVDYLVEHSCGRRITIAEAAGAWKCLEHSKEKTDGWTTDWGGVFGGLSYKSMVTDFSKRYPKVRFDIVDLNFDDAVEKAVPGKPLAKGNATGKYFVPKTIVECDRLISVAAMKANPVGASLSIKNYFGIGPGSKYGFPKLKLHELGDPSEVMVDLFSFHPADYAVVGGCFGVEGDDQVNVRHNVIVAGRNAVAVDAVAAAVMGFDPTEMLFLQNASKKGFGTCDLARIEMRGSSLEEARRRFKADTSWRPASALVS